jgi:hypothetical protein
MGRAAFYSMSSQKSSAMHDNQLFSELKIGHWVNRQIIAQARPAASQTVKTIEPHNLTRASRPIGTGKTTAGAT